MIIEKEILRDIIIKIAEYPEIEVDSVDELDLDIDSDVLDYHVDCLVDELELIKAYDGGTKDRMPFHMHLSLTSKGSQFYQGIKTDTLWEKMKTKFIDSAMDYSIKSFINFVIQRSF